MSNWSIEELESYDNAICEIAKKHGLDWHPIVYEICDYYEMIGHMSYHGLPSHYSHWSYGKSFERTHQSYTAGASGLPYELIINSNPSIAYLMRENPMALQILIMAHCVGHSDFFKNNLTFAETQPDVILPRIRGAKRRVQEYIEDPSIGIEKVEEILDAAHSIRFQTEIHGRKRISHKEKRAEYLKKLRNADPEDKVWLENILDSVPIEPDYDLLGFFIEHGRHLEDWQKDLLDIVRTESLYFVPQIKTKMLNEGWACFWHHKILNELNLPQEYHIHFLKSHNQVVRPHLGSINPYHMGFYLFNRIEEEYGLEHCFFVRETMHDIQAIMQFFDEKMCRDLDLFSYSKRENQRKNQTLTVVDDVGDDIGWEQIKKDLIRQFGINNFPKIAAVTVDKSGALILKHDFDGRELDLDYAEKVVNQITKIWDNDVRMMTMLEGEEVEL